MIETKNASVDYYNFTVRAYNKGGISKFMTFDISFKDEEIVTPDSTVLKEVYYFEPRMYPSTAYLPGISNNIPL